MSIDERDYMRDRNRTSLPDARGLKSSESQKRNQADALKIRFVKYSGSTMPLRLKRFCLFFSLLAAGAVLLTRLPQVAALLPSSHSQPFPATGDVRWYVTRPSGSGDGAPFEIIGPSKPGRNVVVRLDDWNTHALVAIIPIRGGESVTIQVPFGRYRITYAPNLDFYRGSNQVTGRRIDLNEQINGNLKTRQSNRF